MSNIFPIMDKASKYFKDSSRFLREQWLDGVHNFCDRESFTNDKTIGDEASLVPASPLIEISQRTPISACRSTLILPRARAHSWCPFNTTPDGNKPRELVGTAGEEEEAWDLRGIVLPGGVLPAARCRVL